MDDGDEEESDLTSILHGGQVGVYRLDTYSSG